MNELERLQRLRESGAISDAEFEREKVRTLRPKLSPLAFSLIAAAVLFIGVIGLLLGLHSQQHLAGIFSSTGSAAPADRLASSDASVPPRSASQVTAQSSRLQRIFVGDILGAQISYLESIAGPAFHVEDGVRTYKIDGCEVEARAAAGAVASIGMVVNDRCSFDLRPFFGTSEGAKPLQANSLTFGDVDRAFPGGKFTADCLGLCGNAYDPAIGLTYEGAHVDEFHVLAVETTVNTDDAIDPSSNWVDAMKPEGDDYVEKGKFNCDPKYDEVAHRVMAKVRVRKVTVGDNGALANRCEHPRVY